MDSLISPTGLEPLVPEPGTIREAVGVFDGAVELEAAIDDLESAGFDRSELSLLAGHRIVGQKLGHMYARVEDIEDDPTVPRAAYVSREALGDAEGGLIGGLMYIPAVAAAGALVASGGTLAGAVIVAAMAGGAGALIGSVLAQWLGDSHARYLQEQLDRGGLVLWVHIRDDAHEARAVEVLSQHSAHDVHIHELPAGRG